MYNLTTVGWNIGVILHPPLTSAPSLGISSVILSSSNSMIWFSPRMASLEEYSSLTRCTVYSKLLLWNNIVHLLFYESHHSSWQQNVFPCYAALSQGSRGWQCTLSPHPLLLPPVHWTGSASVNCTMSDLLAGSPGVCEVWTYGHPRRRFGMSWWQSHECGLQLQHQGDLNGGKEK